MSIHEDISAPPQSGETMSLFRHAGGEALQEFVDKLAPFHSQANGLSLMTSKSGETSKPRVQLARGQEISANYEALAPIIGETSLAAALAQDMPELTEPKIVTVADTFFHTSVSPSRSKSVQYLGMRFQDKDAGELRSERETIWAHLEELTDNPLDWNTYSPNLMLIRIQPGVVQSGIVKLEALVRKRTKGMEIILDPLYVPAKPV